MRSSGGVSIMKYIPRDYQREAADAAINALREGTNGLVILPTGAGKSIVIALIAKELGEPLLVFQPSKEILEQNYSKLLAIGYDDCSMYSASVRSNVISRVTFATIGTVKNHKEDFAHFKYVLVDECHLVNAQGGLYEDFINESGVSRVVLGLTATPYRLKSYMGRSMLKFITRTRPRIFTKVVYVCQVGDLLRRGYLAPLSYYDLTCIDMSLVTSNSTGADYDEQSLKDEYARVDFYTKLSNTVRRVMNPKNGIPRNGILVFTRFVEEAERLATDIPDAAVVTGDTPRRERERIINGFKDGTIRVVVNVGVLTTGFDYPELDTVILARPTMSLALFYQQVGRAIRPSMGKQGWVIDLCGNYRRFGKVEDLVVTLGGKNNNLWMVKSNGKQLTNVFYE